MARSVSMTSSRSFSRSQMDNVLAYESLEDDADDAENDAGEREE